MSAAGQTGTKYEETMQDERQGCGGIATAGENLAESDGGGAAFINQQTLVRRRPRSQRKATSRSYLLKAKAIFEEGHNLQDSVRLPPDHTLENWLSIHVENFTHRAKLLHGLVVKTGACNDQTCSQFRAGHIEYRWQDNRDFKTPTAMPAPQYMQRLFGWIEMQTEDPDIFPVLCHNAKYPPDFGAVCRKIFSRLFRVFVHVYYHHFHKLGELGAEGHTNIFLLHFYFFVTEFQLVDRVQFAPLQTMIDNLCQQLYDQEHQ